MNAIARPAAVAGSFYPSTREALEAQLAAMPRTPDDERAPALGLVVPHAGYRYSGACAMRGYSSVELPARVLILATDHQGVKPPLALWNGGAWETPLGPCPQADDLIERLATSVPGVVASTRGHDDEHSAEVQVPFVQFEARRQGRDAVAIAVATVGHGAFPALYRAHPAPYDAIERTGRALGAALRDFGEPVLVVASSDLSHERDRDTVVAKDAPALDRLAAYDAPGLYDVLVRDRISMCGGIPALLLMVATQALGGSTADLIAYATSADVSPDAGRAVGYAAVRVR